MAQPSALAGKSNDRPRVKPKPADSPDQSRTRLLQLIGYARERRIQLGADGVDGGDDHHRDAGGDQSIFNGRGAGLVFEERNKF